MVNASVEIVANEVAKPISDVQSVSESSEPVDKNVAEVTENLPQQDSEDAQDIVSDPNTDETVLSTPVDKPVENTEQQVTDITSVEQMKLICLQIPLLKM